jgi:hypothetical protein
VAADWAGKRLSEFVKNGDVDPEFATELLGRMRAECSPPAPQLLGSIGKDHLVGWMVRHGVSASSIQYKRICGEDGSLPYVLEVAFGVNEPDTSCARRIVTGLNWSPVIGGDPDPTLRNAVAEARLDPHDPVMLLVHIARPRFEFADRGKTRVTL